jgi:hypothetical protein
MSDKPHFLARKIQDYQHLIVRGYVCLTCGEYFQHESKLLEHEKLLHQQVSKSSISNEEGDVRKQFRNEVIENTYVIAKLIYLFLYQ